MAAVSGLIPITSPRHQPGLPLTPRKNKNREKHPRNYATIKPKAETAFSALGSAVQGHGDLARKEASCRRGLRRRPAKRGQEVFATGK